MTFHRHAVSLIPTHWEDRKRHTFGVPCGKGWCRVGKKIGKIHSQVSVGEENVGFIDVQRLYPADATEPAKGPISEVAIVEPTGMVASINTDEAFAVAKHMATVRFPDEDSEYARKWGFRKGNNEVRIRRIPTNSGGYEWIAIIDPQDGPRRIKKVIRHESVESPPPVARWGWNPKDEYGWIRCAFGCCEITDDDWE